MFSHSSLPPLLPPSGDEVGANSWFFRRRRRRSFFFASIFHREILNYLVVRDGSLNELRQETDLTLWMIM